MSQPIKSSFNENFNNQVPNVPYFSQQINNNVAELLEKENIDKKDDNFIYELVFNIVSNISNSDKPNDIKIKIIRILTKLIENILKAETFGKDSEKYRRVKITNPNISLLFDIKGNYEFIKLLGFEEEFYNEELCLYLPKENLKIPLFQEVLSYIELLLLNFEENFENNYYESSENNKIEEDEKESNNNINNIEEDIDIENNIHEDNNISNSDNINNVNNIDDYNNMDIKEILKNTKDVRLGNNNNLEYGDNWNIRPAGPSREGARILRQTGQERYRKALQFSNNNSGNNNKMNDNNFHPNIHTFDDFNNYGNSSSFKSNDKFSTVKDEIGKKCLELTNQFRAKNKLAPLKWDDSIWKISLTHSKNMGDGKVPFGHKGFNERIKQFPFHFSLACENVFMCQGYSEYSIAENAVNGWINSPGHRKNLLSNTNFCAIATYRTSSGAYYLTQMFARK
jgi:uncharacterized protein YkwD